MSDRTEVKLTIMEKGYHECSFAVRVGDKCVVKQKRGDRGQLQWSFHLNLLKISPFGVIPSDVKTLSMLY